jgi:hypothetical protein
MPDFRRLKTGLFSKHLSIRWAIKPANAVGNLFGLEITSGRFSRIDGITIKTNETLNTIDTYVR